MRLLNTLLLIAAASCFAAGNVWYAAARSSIPLALNDVVDGVEMRREKHPGKDDVYLLRLHSGRVLQVDRQVADAIETGASVKKEAWSRTLQVDSRAVDLRWSSDFRGMIRAMPVIWLILTAIAVTVGALGAKATKAPIAPANH